MRPHVLVLCLCVVLTLWSCLATLPLKVVIARNEVRAMNGECESKDVYLKDQIFIKPQGRTLDDPVVI